MSPNSSPLKDATREQANLLLSTIYARISRLNAEIKGQQSFAQELFEHFPELYSKTSTPDEIIGRVFWDIEGCCFARTGGFKTRSLSHSERADFCKVYVKLSEDYEATVCPDVDTVLTYSKAQCYELFTMVAVHLNHLNRTDRKRIINPFYHTNSFFTIIVYKAQENADRIRGEIADDITKGTYGDKPYLIFETDEEFGSLEDIHERLELHFPLSQVVCKDECFYFDPSVHRIAEDAVV